MHVGQAEVAALIFKCEFGVIDPEAMQKSGLKIMNMHRVVFGMASFGELYREIEPLAGIQGT